jgi:dynein heavy chain
LKTFSLNFPFENEVYDYYCDFAKKEFKPWSDQVTPFEYDKNLPYSSILVPTADTVKFKFILDKLLRGGNNVLISGETGVGKVKTNK